MHVLSLPGVWVWACVVPFPACQQRLVWACVVVVPFLACHEFLVWVWDCPCALIIMQQRVGLCVWLVFCCLFAGRVSEGVLGMFCRSWCACVSVYRWDVQGVWEHCVTEGGGGMSGCDIQSRCMWLQAAGAVSVNGPCKWIGAAWATLCCLVVCGLVPSCCLVRHIVATLAA